MLVIANQKTKPATKPLTYGDCIGAVISSDDLTQASKSAYLIVQHPDFDESCYMVSLESARTVYVSKSALLGTGYVVRDKATLVLEGL
jgi:hypothetical protein